MAAGSVVMYEKAFKSIANQSLDFENTGVIRAALLDNDYASVVSAADHDAWDDVSAYEVDDSVYTDYAEVVVTTMSIAIVSNKIVFDADNIDFGSSVTITARYLVLYSYHATPSSAKLIFYVDLNDGGSTAVSSVSGDFEIQWNASGIYRFTLNV